MAISPVLVRSTSLITQKEDKSMVVVIRRGVRSNPERLQREMEELFQALDTDAVTQAGRARNVPARHGGLRNR